MTDYTVTEHNKLLTDCQYEFRRGLSTELAINMSGYTPLEMHLLKISEKYIEIIELGWYDPRHFNKFCRNMVKRNCFLTIEILDDMFNFTWTCRLQEEGII